VKQFPLAAKGTKLVLEQNVLAVLSDAPLTTVGSAFHNGGYQKTKVVINTQVTAEYGDVNLHDDPETFVQQAYKKLGLHDVSWGGGRLRESPTARWFPKATLKQP
jgi:hypothetical protein